MSETNRLGIAISANDTASASIRQLQGTIKELDALITKIGISSTESSRRAVEGLTAERAKVQEQINALGQQAGAVKKVTAAMLELGDASGVVHRSLSQALSASFNVDADRQIKSAAESARVLATSLSAAAEADSRLRDAAIASGVALERQAGAMRSVAAATPAFIRPAASLPPPSSPPPGFIRPAASFPPTPPIAAAPGFIRPSAAFPTEQSAPGFIRPSVSLPGERAAPGFIRPEVSFPAERPAPGFIRPSLPRLPSEGGNLAGAITGDVSLLQRESRHIVGLFDSLARGQRGQAISSLGAAARDAGLGVAALSASLTGLVVLMGSAALIHGAEGLGKWATETRAAASAAGMNVQSYSSLQGALALTGLKADSADAALRHLAEASGQAIAEPTSLSAQAFHNLGISQEQLVQTGGDVGQVLKLLADAFVRNADGANKSSNMNQLMGHSFERLLPALQNGRQGLEDLEKKAQRLGLTLNDQTAASLERTGQKATELSESIKGKAIQAFIAWEGPIQVILDLVKELGAELGLVLSSLGKLATGRLPGTSEIFRGPRSLPEFLRLMQEEAKNKGLPGAQAPAGTPELPDLNAFKKARDSIVTPPPLNRGEIVTPIETMRQQMAQAAEAASKTAKTAQDARQAELKAEISVMEETLRMAQLNAKQKVEIETELSHKRIALQNEMLSGETRAAKQSYDDFAASEKLKIAEAQGSTEKILAIYDEWISAAQHQYAQHVSVIANLEREKVQAINKARLEEIKESAQETEKQSRLSVLNNTLSQMAKGKYNYGGQPPTQAQLLDTSQNALQQAAQVKAAAEAEIAALIQVRNTAEAGSSVRKEAEQEITNVAIQAKTQEIELYKKAGEAANEAAKKASEAFTKLFDSFGASIDNFIGQTTKALIAPQQEIIKVGLTSITRNLRGSELKQAFGTLMSSLVQDIGHTLLRAVGSTIAKAVSGGAADSIGQLLSNTFSKLLGSITGNVIGNAAGGAIGGAAGNAAVAAAIEAASATTVSGIDASIIALGADLSTVIGTTGAATVGAIATETSTLSLLLAAVAFKPEVFGTSLAGGGIIPSAAGGMTVNDGRGGTIAILHPQEMVLPAYLSRGIQGMIQQMGSGPVNSSAQLNSNLTINNTSRGRGGTGMTRGEFGQMMALHSGALLGEARNMMRQGWRPG